MRWTWRARRPAQELVQRQRWRALFPADTPRPKEWLGLVNGYSEPFALRMHVTAANDLSVQGVELLDRRSPNWDRKARISSAVRRLRGDMPPETVETLFGKNILASAELRLATTWPEEGFAI